MPAIFELAETMPDLLANQGGQSFRRLVENDQRGICRQRPADRHVIIEKGRVVWTGTSQMLKDEQEVQRRYLGV